MKPCAFWGGSRFNPGELTVTASLLRPTGTEQNTNVHRTQRERERGGDKQDKGRGEEREREETSVRRENPSEQRELWRDGMK